MPRIGELKTRVAIQAVAEAVDAYYEDTGGDVTTVATVWARVRPISAGEQRRAGQLVPQALFEVVMRYRSDVTESHRLSWSGKTLEVVGASFDQAKRWLTVTASEVPG